MTNEFIQALERTRESIGRADLLDKQAVAILSGKTCTKSEADEAERVFLAADKAESLDSFNNTPYLKPESSRKPETIGGLRI